MKRKIKRELPKVGTILNGKFKGKEYKAKIVKDNNFPEGRGIRFKNKTYKSMTGAAIAITKQSTNGWRFWKF
jgi:hypothetical protein